MRKILLVLGDMLSGKTSLCKSLFSRLTALSLKPYAIVEENERDDLGIPVKLFLHELNTGKISLLGTREASRHQAPTEASKYTKSTLPKSLQASSPLIACARENYGPFKFSAEVFVEAASRLTSAWNDGFSPIILDEVGPLELLERAGFREWLIWALSQKDCFLVISMRPGLKSSFMDLIDANTLDAQGLAIKSFSFAELNDEKMLEALSKEILRHCHD